MLRANAAAHTNRVAQSCGFFKSVNPSVGICTGCSLDVRRTS
jgi:hypothetical protein